MHLLRLAFFVRDAYIAVIRLVESVDDTITCQKTILAELLKPLEVSCNGTTVDA